MKRPLAIASCVLTATLAVTSARAQVVISEIEFTSRNSEGQWIEIANLGTSEVDLSAWSIYQATQTPSRVQNYWWGFPTGTRIAGGSFLRVHWLEAPRASTATDVWTGDTVFHFLFGLFAENLDPNRGALALMNTQSSTQVNDAARVMDWVSWGTTGFKREELAVRNNRWKDGTAAPAATGSPAPTLAYDYTNFAGIHEGSFWFRDSSPTPGKTNLSGAVAIVYGTGCKGTLNETPSLDVNGKPIAGNRDFYVGVDRALLPTEFAMALIGARGDGSFNVFGCPFLLNLQVGATPLLIEKSGNLARILFGNLDPTILEGIQLAVQIAVFEPKPIEHLGFTDAVELVFGSTK